MYIYIYILFHILFHCGLLQDIEYSSLCYTVGPCCLFIHYSFLKLINLFIFGSLGLRCCAQAFSSCGEWGLFFLVVHGRLIAVASLVEEHRL